MRRKSLSPLLSLLLGVLSCIVHAAPPDHHDHGHHPQQNKQAGGQQHAAHVHGEAELSIAQEGSQIDIILLSPAMNIVGFEKPTGSPEQKAAIQRAEQQLAKPDSLFTISGGKCALESMASNISELLPGHALSSAEGETEAHHDIEAHFRYRCAAPQAIEKLNVELFDAFPSIETVFAQWVNEHGQGAQSLSRGSRRLTWK